MRASGERARVVRSCARRACVLLRVRPTLHTVHTAIRQYPHINITYYVAYSRVRRATDASITGTGYCQFQFNYCLLPSVFICGKFIIIIITITSTVVAWVGVEVGLAGTVW